MDLQSNRIEAIFRKGMDPEIDSYSGFYDNGRRKNTGLHGYLQDRNITEVHIAGLAADFCVYFTAMDALELGYRTGIVSKGTNLSTKPRISRRKNNLSRKTAFLFNSQPFITKLLF